MATGAPETGWFSTSNPRPTADCPSRGIGAAPGEKGPGEYSTEKALDAGASARVAMSYATGRFIFGNGRTGRRVIEEGEAGV